MRPSPFVLWNLFLAVVPVALAFLIARGVRRDRQAKRPVRWVLWGPLALVWLLAAESESPSSESDPLETCTAAPVPVLPTAEAAQGMESR